MADERDEIAGKRDLSKGGVKARIDELVGPQPKPSTLAADTWKDTKTTLKAMGVDIDGIAKAAQEAGIAVEKNYTHIAGKVEATLGEVSARVKPVAIDLYNTSQLGISFGKIEPDAPAKNAAVHVALNDVSSQTLPGKGTPSTGKHHAR